MKRAWDAFWFRQASPRGVIAARILIAANAFWIIASHPDLYEVLAWPRPFWSGVPAMTGVRFGYAGLPMWLEVTLYGVLAALVLLVMLGVKVRILAAAAALLIYHFAPLVDIIAGGAGPYFNGLTIAVLGFLVLAFSPHPRSRHDQPSPEFRWPFAMIQLLFAFNYLLAGVSKLRHSGLSWISGDNIRSTIVVFNAFEPANRPLAHYLIAHPWLCTLIAVATVLMEISIVIVLFSPLAAMVVVPLLVTAHLGIMLTLGVVFLNLPLVLLLLPWDRVRGDLSARVDASPLLVT